MLTIQQQAIALAFIANSSWSWELRVDDVALFRWYMDGVIETNLRGVTPGQAESALRRFVNDSLQGELRLIYLSEHMGPGSERGDSLLRSGRVG